MRNCTEMRSVRPAAKAIFTLLAVCAASLAQAQSGVQCNQHGAVVTLSNGTIYYLGKTCDAAQKGGGTGRWYLAASAFVVEINGQAVRLPFEVDCELPACWAS